MYYGKTLSYRHKRVQVKTGTLANSWNPGGVVGCWVSTRMFQRNFTIIQYAAIMQEKKPHFSLRWRNSFPLHMRERLFQLKKPSWKSEGFKNTHCQRTVMKLSQTHGIIYKSLSYLQVTIIFTCSFVEENANL